MLVPEFPQSKLFEGGRSFDFELIITVDLFIISISTPSFLKIFNVDFGSCPSEKFLIVEMPSAKDAKITALCEIDLSAGIVISPFSVLKFFDTFFC